MNGVYKMLHTHTPIIGQFEIQNIPTSVYPWTATDGSWMFLSSPFSEASGRRAPWDYYDNLLVSWGDKGSEAMLSFLTANAKKERKWSFLLSWHLCGSPWAPCGGFLPVRKPVLSDLFSVPHPPVLFPIRLLCHPGTFFLSIPGKGSPCPQIVYGSHSISERRGRALFLGLYLWF